MRDRPARPAAAPRSTSVTSHTGVISADYRGVAFWVAGVSLAMYAINVGLMDLPWALRYRCAVGDTSGLWQIAPVPAVIFSALMVTSRVLLVVLSAEPAVAAGGGRITTFGG